MLGADFERKGAFIEPSTGRLGDGAGCSGLSGGAGVGGTGDEVFPLGKGKGAVMGAGIGSWAGDSFGSPPCTGPMRAMTQSQAWS